MAQLVAEKIAWFEQGWNSPSHTKITKGWFKGLLWGTIYKYHNSKRWWESGFVLPSIQQCSPEKPNLGLKTRFYFKIWKLLFSFISSCSREGIIVPVLKRFGKLNFTYLGNLRRRSRRGCQSTRGFVYWAFWYHFCPSNLFTLWMGLFFSESTCSPIPLIIYFGTLVYFSPLYL